MKNAIVTALCVICCIVLACTCFAESEYDPRSEGYFVVGTEDSTALKFADDFAESNLGLYQQFGVKTALYLFDSIEGMEITDDIVDAVMSIHNSVVGDSSNDMVILIVLDKNEYRFWLGENVNEMCTEDALQKILDDVESEDNDSIFAEVSKAYVGVSYQMFAASINASMNGGK